jgi:hypothetical protein
MGIRDEMERAFGDSFFQPTASQLSRHNWHEVCVCGHLGRYHSESTGGLYQLPAPRTQTAGGEEVTVTAEFTGCAGALPVRGFETETMTIDREAHTIVNKVNATCPCDSFRPVAKVDRPNRYWNQRMPPDREDAARHPMVVGVRAFMTHLSRRRAALSDPSWAEREFDRRFLWLDGARVCAISKCSETVDVWPVFVTDALLSELRCPAHR